jgi:hypothetical protein
MVSELRSLIEILKDFCNNKSTVGKDWQLEGFKVFFKD